MRLAMHLLLFATAVFAGDPAYLDLSGFVNRASQDDGISDNGIGGWTDEGINDMCVFPPLDPGIHDANGVRFLILPPSKDGGKQVLMLKGERFPDLPVRVTVPAGDKSGRYIYFVHHIAVRPTDSRKEEIFGHYIVNYADGTSAVIDLRDGRELRPWWASSWWDNSEADAWPVYMGCNPYSIKWHKPIGLWATRWSNPQPAKPISSITLSTIGRATIAIWSITIDDRDFRSADGLNPKLEPPPDPPPGYFEPRLFLERQAIADEMSAAGMLQGVRSVEVIAPDLLAVTIDSKVSGGPGMDAAAPQAMRFMVNVGGGPEQPPAQVGRYSYLYNTVDFGNFPQNQLYWHIFYLRLAQPLSAGVPLVVVSAGAGWEQRSQPIVWDPKTTITPALKVNQVAYCASATKRFSYLGWWAGDLGAVDFSSFDRFTVINELNGAVALQGAIEPRQPVANTAPDSADLLSGELVRQIDLSRLTPGRYHLVVPGLGRSWSFAVGGEASWNIVRTVMKGLLVQRCGCELTPQVTDFPRHACHVQVYEHGHLVGGINEQWKDGVLTVKNPPMRANEPIHSFRGGYHDAGDFDLFAIHLLGSSRLLTAYELAPDLWQDGDLNLPESGNHIPDILDECEWGLRFYAENQQADGAVPAGRGNDEDYQRETWPTDGRKEFGQEPPFGVLPPTRTSSALFAAVAAQYARMVAPFDAARATRYLERAERAWAWAAQEGGSDYRNKGITIGPMPWQRALVWGAAELWQSTGKEEYHRHVLAERSNPIVWKPEWNDVANLPFLAWAYCHAGRIGSDSTYQDELRKIIMFFANEEVAAVQRPAYRMSARDDGAGGWGSAVGGAQHGAVCMYAWFLTKDQVYLDAASLNADYQLGCNPLGRSFITGLGSRPPEHPELRPWLYRDGKPAPGITVYGPGGGVESMRTCYPTRIPPWRCWLDIPNSEIHSEFGATTIMENAGFYGLLWISTHNSFSLQKPK